MKENIILEANFNTIINEWKKLLINEKFEEETNNLDTEIDFFNLEIHPAENQATK
ncbi:7592_t:CDS:1, partial [Dentiscutata heterogama]